LADIPTSALLPARADESPLRVPLHQAPRPISRLLAQKVLVRPLLKLNAGNAAREKRV